MMGKLDEMIDDMNVKYRAKNKLEDEINRLQSSIDKIHKQLIRRLYMVTKQNRSDSRIDTDGNRAKGTMGKLLVWFDPRLGDHEKYFAGFGLTVVNDELREGGFFVWLEPEEIARLNVTVEEIEL